MLGCDVMTNYVSNAILMAAILNEPEPEPRPKAKARTPQPPGWGEFREWSEWKAAKAVVDPPSDADSEPNAHCAACGDLIPPARRAHSHVCADCGITSSEDEPGPSRYSSEFHYNYDEDNSCQFTKPWEMYGDFSD